MLRQTKIINNNEVTIAVVETEGDSNGKVATKSSRIITAKNIFLCVLLLFRILCIMAIILIIVYNTNIDINAQKRSPQIQRSDNIIVRAKNVTSTKRFYKVKDVIDLTCSTLPKSITDLEFPLLPITHSKGQSLRDRPLMWIFDSGVMLRTQYLKESQLNRFWNTPGTNYWETSEEELILEAIRELYHYCEDATHIKDYCVFIDGGAAYGYYTQLIRIHFPLVKVIAFNPHPTFCKQMIDNLALAHLNNVCLHQVALSQKSGTAVIRYGTAMKLTEDEENINNNDAVEVSVASLDQYYDDTWGINEKNKKLIVFIKLDIEGDAGNVIRGSPKMFNAAYNVLVGLHNSDETNACKGLTTFGFNVTTPKHKKGTPNSFCIARKT